MKHSRAQLFFLPADGSVTRAFTAGVSLHSHTEHSQEKLAQLPRYLEQMPVVSQFLRWERNRYHAKTGRRLDFSRAYWRGPLSAQAAHELERRQIEDLNLRAMVSLTDHDNIDAPLLLQSGNAAGEIPISLECTVPYEQTYFHFGVHNIAPSVAASYMEALAAYTREPRVALLCQLLEILDADPRVLIVVNHPLWDMAEIGSGLLMTLLRQFLRVHGNRVHALEINGLRSWRENLAAVSLANETGHAVVAGGDRHGLEPNAMINVTRAATFDEFVEEIRKDRSSDMLVLPQYREPLALRQLLTAWDAAREHPQFAERERWDARVFVLCHDGVERPISAVFPDGFTPAWIDPCLNVMGLIASPPIRTAARLAFQASGNATP